MEYTAADIEEALAPIDSLIRKSEKALGKLAPNRWQAAMLRDNVQALRLASTLMRDTTGDAPEITRDDMVEALGVIASMIGRTENTQTAFAPGTSQHTLQHNRSRALRVAEAVIQSALDEGAVDPTDPIDDRGAAMPGSAETLWAEFIASASPLAASAADASYTAWQFGCGVEQGDRLLEHVLAGPKRATAGALWAYEAEGEPVPVVGDFSVLLDGHGIARCVIRTTSVDVVPFEEVDEAFAYDEGEGDRSLAYWRDAHWEYFTRELASLGIEAVPGMPVVCERFEIVYPIELAD